MSQKNMKLAQTFMFVCFFSSLTSLYAQERTTSQPTNGTDGNEDYKNIIPLAIAIAIPSIILAIAIALSVFCYQRKKKRTQRSEIGSDYQLFSSDPAEITQTAPQATVSNREKPVPPPRSKRNKSLDNLNDDNIKKIPIIPKKSNTTGRTSQDVYKELAKENRRISLPARLQNSSVNSTDSEEIHTYENTNETISNSGSAHQMLTVKATDENYMQPHLHLEIPTSINIAYRSNCISALEKTESDHSQPSFSADHEDTDHEVDSEEARDVPIHSYDEPHTFWNHS